MPELKLNMTIPLDNDSGYVHLEIDIRDLGQLTPSTVAAEPDAEQDLNERYGHLLDEPAPATVHNRRQ